MGSEAGREGAALVATPTQSETETEIGANSMGDSIKRKAAKSCVARTSMSPNARRSSLHSTPTRASETPQCQRANVEKQKRYNASWNEGKSTCDASRRSSEISSARNSTPCDESMGRKDLSREAHVARQSVASSDDLPLRKAMVHEMAMHGSQSTPVFSARSSKVAVERDKLIEHVEVEDEDLGEAEELGPGAVITDGVASVSPVCVV